MGDTSVDLLAHLHNICDDLESLIFHKWVHKCRFVSATDFIRFENMFQLAGIGTYRKAIGTDFPHLRFRKFYLFIYKTSEEIKNLSPASIVAATSTFPVLFKSTVRKQVELFYRKSFILFYLDDVMVSASEKMKRYAVNEIKLIRLFQNEMMALSKRANALLKSVWLSMTCQLSRSAFKTILRILLEKEGDLCEALSAAKMKKMKLSEFQERHLTQTVKNPNKKFVHLVSGKVREALLKGDKATLERNFPGFGAELWLLYREISEFSESLYVLYHPILNWIYEDLGCES